jgi:FAD-linked sulfhydryl oxidase
MKSVVGPQVIEYPLSKQTWGSSLWNYLHTMATNFPNSPRRSDKLEARESLYHFVKNIPCLSPCRTSAINYMKVNPPNLESKEGYFDWTVNFHNFVNRKLGKPEQQVKLNNDVIIEEKLSGERSALTMESLFGINSTRHKEELMAEPTSLDSEFQSKYPQYNSIIKGDVPVEQAVQDGVISQEERFPQTQNESRDNSLSSLEGGYRWIEEHLGVRASDLNLTFTPQLLGGIVQNLTISNLSPFANFSLSLLAAISMFAVGIFNRNNMGYGDRLLLQGFTASYVSSMVELLNSKNRGDVIAGGSRFVELASGWGSTDEPVKKLLDVIIETPEKYRDRTQGKGEFTPLSGFEATLVDDPAFAGQSIKSTRDLQAGGLRNLDSNYPKNYNRPVTGLNPSSAITVSRPSSQEKNTLRPFVDRANFISNESIPIEEVPIKSYLLPR